MTNKKKAYAIKNENIVYIDCVSEIRDTLGVKINDKANENEIKEICELIKKFQKVFEQTEQLSCITEVPITTVEGKSEFVRQHPIPHKFKDGLKNEILKMLKMGIIEPCKNPRGWNSPILPVKEKNGEIRLCANFKRTINLHLSESSDKYQLPVTEPLFQQIGKNKYFASFDVRSSYWQLKIREQDRYKTAFQFENQCYNFIRLPYGLKNSGDLFCRTISDCFKDVKNTEFIKHFVDDILCHTKTFEEYKLAITEIFEICLK